MTHIVEPSRARSVAIRLLRWYPRPWRRRYLAEMQALLEQMTVGWRQVVNVAAIGMREWLSPRALGWPARKAAGRVQTVRALRYFAVAYVLDGAARAVAWRVGAAGISFTESASVAAALLVFGPIVRVFVAMISYQRHQRKFPKLPEHQRPGRVHGWEIALWACLLFPFLVINHAEPTPTYLSRTMLQMRPYMELLRIFVWTNLMLGVSGQTRRLRRVQSSWLRRHLGYQPTPRVIEPS